VVVVVLTLGIMVDAPFLDEQRDLAREFGVSQALVTAWYIGRWPVVLLVLVAFLLCLYRFAPSVRHAWRHLVPGAVLGVLLWILAAVAFRVYLAFGGGDPTGVMVNDARVVIIGQAVGALVATVLWTYFSSVAILVGNELNAELARRRGQQTPGRSWSARARRSSLPEGVRGMAAAKRTARTRLWGATRAPPTPAAPSSSAGWSTAGRPW
jgi:membrane protein